MKLSLKKKRKWYFKNQGPPVFIKSIKWIATNSLGIFILYHIYQSITTLRIVF